MTKTWTQLWMTTTFALAFAAVAHAQQPVRRVVEIGFSFGANGKMMPAGRYQISVENWNRLTLRNTNTGAGAFLSVRPKPNEVVTASAATGEMTFRCYAEFCGLSQIRMPGSTTAFETPQPRKAMAAGVPSTVATLRLLP